MGWFWTDENESAAAAASFDKRLGDTANRVRGAADSAGRRVNDEAHKLSSDVRNSVDNSWLGSKLGSNGRAVDDHSEWHQIKGDKSDDCPVVHPHDSPSASSSTSWLPHWGDEKASDKMDNLSKIKGEILDKADDQKKSWSAWGNKVAQDGQEKVEDAQNEATRLKAQAEDAVNDTKKSWSAWGSSVSDKADETSGRAKKYADDVSARVQRDYEEVTRKTQQGYTDATQRLEQGENKVKSWSNWWSGAADDAKAKASELSSRAKDQADDFTAKGKQAQLDLEARLKEHGDNWSNQIDKFAKDGKQLKGDIEDAAHDQAKSWSAWGNKTKSNAEDAIDDASKQAEKWKAEADAKARDAKSSWFSWWNETSDDAKSKADQVRSEVDGRVKQAGDELASKYDSFARDGKRVKGDIESAAKDHADKWSAWGSKTADDASKSLDDASKRAQQLRGDLESNVENTKKSWSSWWSNASDDAKKSVDDLSAKGQQAQSDLQSKFDAHKDEFASKLDSLSKDGKRIQGDVEAAARQQSDKWSAWGSKTADDASKKLDEATTRAEQLKNDVTAEAEKQKKSWFSWGNAAVDDASKSLDNAAKEGQRLKGDIDAAVAQAADGAAEKAQDLKQQGQKLAGELEGKVDEHRRTLSNWGSKATDEASRTIDDLSKQGQKFADEFDSKVYETRDSVSRWGRQAVDETSQKLDDLSSQGRQFADDVSGKYQDQKSSWLNWGSKKVDALEDDKARVKAEAERLAQKSASWFSLGERSRADAQVSQQHQHHYVDQSANCTWLKRHPHSVLAPHNISVPPSEESWWTWLWGGSGSGSGSGSPYQPHHLSGTLNRLGQPELSQVASDAASKSQSYCPVPHDKREKWMKMGSQAAEAKAVAQDFVIADEVIAPHKDSESKCPVPHDKRETWVEMGNKKKQQQHSSDSLNPMNMMPELSSQRVAGQTLDLPTERTWSTIPRGEKDDEGVWEYPSPQQMFNAMVRKSGSTDEIPEDAVESMVDVHNFLNEGAWQDILQWEAKYTAESGREPRLLKFQGRPDEMSPRATMLQWGAKVWPSKFGMPVPFDRHDWTVLRGVANSDDTKRVRYVIDYYTGPDDEDTGMPSFILDVRPALDSVEAAKDRFDRSVAPVWNKAMGRTSSA